MMTEREQKLPIYAAVLLMAILSSSLGCRKRVDYQDYYLMKEKYAEVLVDKDANSRLLQFCGELGEDDKTLVAFFVQKQHKKIFLLIEQYKEEEIILCPVYIPDTTMLFTYSSRYETPFIIYDDIQTFTIKKIINEYITAPLHVVDVEELWLKIRVNDGSDIWEGWISPDEYCSNPYTTCN